MIKVIEPATDWEAIHNKTKEVVAEMMKESTGTHFLDSGMASGRYWQRNQKRDFDSEPYQWVNFKYGYIEHTVNLYHYLVENLTFYPELQDEFDQWVEEESNDDMSHFRDIENFVELERTWKGEDWDSMFPWTVNTYNGEELLSQTIQYTAFEWRDTNVLLLQIHGGADVRGGYTAPKAFSLDHEYLMPQDVYIDCSNNHEHNWYTNDAYHYCFDGSSMGTRLGQYKIIEIDKFAKVHPSIYRAFNLQPKIYVDQDGNGTCPICGNGVLK